MADFGDAVPSARSPAPDSNRRTSHHHPNPHSILQKLGEAGRNRGSGSV